MYRAWNVNGAGPWSDFGFIIAAQVPSRPGTPTYISSDSNSITLGFSPSSNNGGLIITEMILQISNFLATDWTDVTSY
jgi:hypothetical protein